MQLNIATFGEVFYSWHPWHGLRVQIVEEISRGGQRFLRCRLDGSGSDRMVELPAWMFDRVSCCRMILKETAVVEVNVLRVLQGLLRSTRPQASSNTLHNLHTPLFHQEMPMPTRTKKHVLEEKLNLFSPKTPRPYGINLPMGVRSKTLTLLGRLLVSHRHVHLDREVKDER